MLSIVKTDSSPSISWWELPLLAVVMMWGASARWALIGHGPTSDEISLLKWRGWEWIFRDTANRWHPPLYRMSFTAWLEPEQALTVARHVSLVAGVLTIALVWLLARGLTRSRLLALAAGLGLAALPHHMLFSVMFRPYAVLLMLMCVHLVCLSRWIPAGAPRWTVWGVGLTATLLPQIHYIALPWLALTAVGTAVLLTRSWRTLLPYLGAPLMILPVLGHITANMGGAQPISPDWMKLTTYLFGMGLEGKPTMPTGRYFWPLGVVAAVALTLRWRWLRTPGRVLVVGTVSMLGAVAWVSGEHRLTPSTRLLIAPLLWVMLAALPQLIPARGWTSKTARWTAAVVLAGLTAQMVDDRLTYKRDHPSPSDQIVNFIRAVPDRFPEDHAIRFSTSSHLAVARYICAGEIFASSEVADGCPNTQCSNIDGRLWMVDPKDGHDGASILVLRRTKLPPRLDAGCTLAQAEEGLPRFAICEERAEPNRTRESGWTDPKSPDLSDPQTSP